MEKFKKEPSLLCTMSLYDKLKASSGRFAPANLLIPAIAAMYLATGCGQQETKQPEQPKTAASSSIDKAVTQELTDQKLIQLYKQALSEVGQYEDEKIKALEGVAARSGIRLDQIEDDDYMVIVKPSNQRRLNDQSIKPILELLEIDKSRLISLVNRNIDPEKIRRSKEIFYAKREVPVFKDYGFFINAVSNSPIAIPYPVAIRNPLVYTIDSGRKIEAIGFGDRLWVPKNYYDTKLTDYARGVMESDLTNLTRFSAALATFIMKIKPKDNADQINAMIKDQSSESRNAIENALGIATGSDKFITYTTVLTPTDSSLDSMNKRLGNMRLGIAELKESLGHKK